MICIFGGIWFGVIEALGGQADRFDEGIIKQANEALRGRSTSEELVLVGLNSGHSFGATLSVFGPASTAFLMLPLVAIFWFRNGAGIRAWKAADSLLRPSAETVLARDERAPVIVLRSFADDDTSLSADNMVAGAMRPRVRMEEAVVPVLRSIGPVVAIGQPSERIPRLGADRAYFPDDDWQAAITRWIKISSVIVVFVGKGEGLRWELREIAKADAWRKVLVVFPSVGGAAKRDLWQELARSWPAIADIIADTDIDFAATMVSLVGGASICICGPGRKVSDYEAAAIAACDIWMGSKKWQNQTASV